MKGDAPGASDVAKSRVLIVDGDALSNRVMVLAFRMRGFACHAVESEAEALTAIEEFEPDVVVLVLEWASRFARRIDEAARICAHARAYGRPVGVVVVTHECDRPGSDDLTEVDAYFTKPVIFPALEEAILNIRDHRAR